MAASRCPATSDRAGSRIGQVVGVLSARDEAEGVPCGGLTTGTHLLSVVAPVRHDETPQGSVRPGQYRSPAKETATPALEPGQTLQRRPPRTAERASTAGANAPAAARSGMLPEWPRPPDGGCLDADRCDEPPGRGSAGGDRPDRAARLRLRGFHPGAACRRPRPDWRPGRSCGP
jgi:hypothetical protein